MGVVPRATATKAVAPFVQKSRRSPSLIVCQESSADCRCWCLIVTDAGPFRPKENGHFRNFSSCAYRNGWAWVVEVKAQSFRAPASPAGGEGKCDSTVVNHEWWTMKRRQPALRACPRLKNTPSRARSVERESARSERPTTNRALSAASDEREKTQKRCNTGG